MESLERAYVAWLDKHKSEASGERLRRLTKKHGYGEKLVLQQAWWPVLGNFDLLYPEFEFVDIDGKHYFIDLAYMRLPRPTAVESDSYGSHLRDIDRDEFSRGLDRQNEIVLANWNIIRFSTDKLKENPFACQRTVSRMLDVWYGEDDISLRALNIYQREIMRTVTRSSSPLSVEDACQLLGKKAQFTRTQLHSLTELGLLEAASGSERIHFYRLKANNIMEML
ncbi:hypothetical protein [Cohnella sp. GCM10027633]|uniref:hypothetical protein n=1 Tax=unclassified Cohnella TaxID=2636738 RepID=UPI003636347A